ncbi:hypothetical protein COU76_03275 [Candidatus Peregrinibacteria bacterium CG10_big_fil_rev_8_21_14_0_10_49_10]|nr:MAG: hypothetical protein COU76_03275 [Candidatus Peregrinibacteria bacterium CG10_big_fil_rev_8_21_14_0_10_49_10]
MQAIHTNHHAQGTLPTERKGAIARLNHILIACVRAFIHVLIFGVIIALLIFMATEVRDILEASVFDPQARNFLHDTAFVLVFIKALKILISYLETGRIAIRYLIEIVIIAPAIEIVFAPEKLSTPLLVIFALFSIVHLVIYLLLYDRIIAVDRNSHAESKEQYKMA